MIDTSGLRLNPKLFKKFVNPLDDPIARCFRRIRHAAAADFFLCSEQQLTAQPIGTEHDGNAERMTSRVSGLFRGQNVLCDRNPIDAVDAPCRVGRIQIRFYFLKLRRPELIHNILLHTE